MITMQTAENALKTVYLGTITEIMNTKINPLLSKIESTASDVWGKEIHTVARCGINGGFGAGAEDGPLPQAKGSNYIKFVSTLKNLYGKLEISDKAIRAGVEGKGAFTDLLNSEIESLINASKFNMGRMLYGDGNGILAMASEHTDKTVIKVDNTRCFAPGMLVDGYYLGEFVFYGIPVVEVNHNDKTITLASKPDITICANCEFYVQGSRDNELTGIGALFGNSQYLYGNEREKIKSILPYHKKNQGLLDEVSIQEVIDKAENDSNSTINFIAVSGTAKYAYQEYMAQYKRNIDIMQLEGGFKSLSYNGIPLVYERFVNDGEMFFLDTTKFKLHQLCDWRFLENVNGRILHQSEGKPVYSATLVKYCDLICSTPNGQAKISGITRQ